MKIFLILFCFLLNSCVAISGTIDPENMDSSYISYAKNFTYVGRLIGRNKDGSNFSASAVAIDHHHILTAAHVIIDQKQTFVNFEKKQFFIHKFLIPKKFKNDRSGFGDIAIGYSKKSFDMTFYPPLYDKKDEINKVCCICGFGETGTFISGATKFDRKKRAGSNVVEKIYRDLLLCKPSANNSFNRTSLEFLIANGDSGGGLFIDGKLAGINSCIMSVDSHSLAKYNDESGHTRVSNFSDWILSNLTK